MLIPFSFLTVCKYSHNMQNQNVIKTKSLQTNSLVIGRAKSNVSEGIMYQRVINGLLLGVGEEN